MFHITKPSRDFEKEVIAALHELSSLVSKSLLSSGGVKSCEPETDTALGVAKRLYALRRLREVYFARSIFGEPSWDILLDLYVARAESKRITVSSACIASAVPATTGLRWITTLEEEGLIRRYREGTDRRLVFVTLTDLGFGTLTRFLEQVAFHQV